MIDAQPEVINLIGESREGIPLEFPWNVWGDVGIVPPPCPGWNGYVAGECFVEVVVLCLVEGERGLSGNGDPDVCQVVRQGLVSRHVDLGRLWGGCVFEKE